MKKEHCLIGKKILSMMIADDRIAVRFDTDAGEIVAECDGDCCSRTWVEGVELPALGFPATVTEVINLMMPDATGDDEDGYLIQFYGVQIKTDKGEIVIDYRNESNGYYGGSLTWPGEDHYGGVFDQNRSSRQWVEIAKEARPE